MRRLCRHHAVQLQFDAETGPLSGQVLSVTHALARLACAEMSADTATLLRSGYPAFLTFEHHDTLVALRGIAATEESRRDEVAFVVTDGVQVPERRACERVPISVSARLSPLDTGDHTGATIETVTTNVSLGGMLIRRRDDLGVCRRFRIELASAPDQEPLKCEAQVIRATRSHVAMKFNRLEQPEQTRLAALLCS